MPRINNIQVRRGTSSSWTSVDPILDSGEIGFETDTGKFKIGDGTTIWSLLDYAASTSLADLSDVNLQNPLDGDVLSYDESTSKWISKSISGLSGGGFNKIWCSEIGSYSNAGGAYCDATGEYSFAIGYNSDALGDYSSALGKGAKARLDGQKAYSSGYFLNIGDSQFSKYFLRAETSNSSSKTLTIDGEAPSGINILKISPKSTWTFDIKLSAYNYTDDLSASFIIRGSIRRNNSNSTVLLGSVVSDVFYESLMSNCTAVVSADDANECLSISVTGLSNKNILWHATVDVSEVRKASSPIDDDFVDTPAVTPTLTPTATSGSPTPTPTPTPTFFSIY